MKVKPLHDKVLVKRIDAPEKTKGGIIVPDTATEKPQEGKVVAVGTGIIMPDGSVKPLDVKKNDKILFTKYGGTELTVEGEDCIILRDDEIREVIEQEKRL